MAVLKAEYPWHQMQRTQVQAQVQVWRWVKVVAELLVADGIVGKTSSLARTWPHIFPCFS